MFFEEYELVRGSDSSKKHLVGLNRQSDPHQQLGGLGEHSKLLQQHLGENSGKLADQSIYFTFHNFFFFILLALISFSIFFILFFFTMSKAISVSTGMIFTIFSPNGRFLREFS